MESVEPGRLVAGRYRLGAAIGRGGMGVVWRASDELLSRDVAVKELVWPAYFSETERQAACRRAIREAQLAARLTHRNVIRIFDIVEEDDGCPWIVMELLPYRSLRDQIKEDGPLSPAAAAEVGLGILAALCAAHEQGIVHRDVKPANILLARDRVVLTDFGIARAAGTSTLTTVGVLLGSPSYISPERARGRQSGPPGDLWGLGAVLYAAVEGHGPFDRDGDALASMTAVVADELEPATHAGRLWPVINGLLRKDPDERLDAAAAERMLRDVGAAPAAPVSPAAPPSTAPPAFAVIPRSRRSRAPAVALAGLTAFGAIAVSGSALGLVLTSSQRGETSASSAPPSAAPSRASGVGGASGVSAPASGARPATAASIPASTPANTPTARTHLTASATRTRALPPSATRLVSATTSSRTRKAKKGRKSRNGNAYRGWPAFQLDRFAFFVPDFDWRSYSFRWRGPASWGRTRRHR
jgi:serine/threonine protein kinase